MFIELDNHGYTGRMDVFTGLQSRLEWNYKPDVQDMIECWNANIISFIVPMEGVFETLDILADRGLKLGIVTNGSSLMQNAKIDKFNLRRYMQTVIISKEVGVRKPEAEIFNLALAEIKSDAHSTVYVGDNPINDMLGAINADITPIWMNKGQSWSIEQYKPQYIISRLTELLVIL